MIQKDLCQFIVLFLITIIIYLLYLNISFDMNKVKDNNFIISV